MKKILVVGSANMDLVVKVPYMPSVGETILGESFMQSLGGKRGKPGICLRPFGGRSRVPGCCRL